MKDPIQITEKAAEQIQKLMKDAPEGTQGLRLNIKATGCSGNSYKMEYVSTDDDLSTDEKFEQNDASIFIPKLYSWMLFGTTIDYIIDELGNTRLISSILMKRDVVAVARVFKLAVNFRPKLKQRFFPKLGTQHQNKRRLHVAKYSEAVSIFLRLVDDGIARSCGALWISQAYQNLSSVVQYRGSWLVQPAHVP